MLNDLNDLNAFLASAADTRPWVSWVRVRRCTNCSSEHRDPPILMREERKGHYVRAQSEPTQGTTVGAAESPGYFRWCEKCDGERPLRISLTRALESAGNDRELAQRVGHIIADFFTRKRVGGEG